MLSMVRYQGAQAQLRAPRSTFTAAMSAFGFVFRAPDIAGYQLPGYAQNQRSAKNKPRTRTRKSFAPLVHWNT